MAAMDFNARPPERFAAFDRDKEEARFLAGVAAWKAGYDPTTASDESYQELKTLPGLGDDEHGWRYEAEYRWPGE